MNSAKDSFMNFLGISLEIPKIMSPEIASIPLKGLAWFFLVLCFRNLTRNFQWSLCRYLSKNVFRKSSFAFFGIFSWIFTDTYPRILSSNPLEMHSESQFARDTLWSIFKDSPYVSRILPGISEIPSLTGPGKSKNFSQAEKQVSPS